MTVNGHRISICIPAKDEAATIEEVIDRSRPHGDEIFVVDGHSKDQTRELAEAMGVPVYLDAGLGKGCAVREAVARATGDILVTIDADLSFDPGDIPRLVAPVANGAAEYGSGDLDKFIRMVGQDIITLGVNYRFDVRLTDSQSGFRAFDLAAARSITLVENITTTEQEMIIKFLRKGYRIVEVPTHEYASRRDRSHISLRRHAARYVYSWLRYLFF